MAKKVKLSFKNTVSRCKQSFRSECDINRIVARARKTGYLIDPSIVANRQAVFMDCSQIDYMDMLNRVNVAQRAFDALPSDIALDKNSSIGKHPSDYKLMLLGEFDNVSGVFEGKAIPELVCTAERYREEVTV